MARRATSLAVVRTLGSVASIAFSLPTGGFAPPPAAPSRSRRMTADTPTPPLSVAEAVRTRRTHKLFAPSRYAAEHLEQLFDLARWAPNHRLTQPWRFRVLGPRRWRG